MAITGTNYKSGRDISEIAKLIRAELKAETKAGRLPKACRFGVRVQRYSMGQSLTVTIKAVPEGFRIVNAERAKLDRDQPHFPYHTMLPTHPAYSRRTPEADELIERVTGIVNSFNRRDVDSSTDYYNVTFSEHVGFCDKLTAADKALALAEIDARDNGSEAPEAAPEAPAEPQAAPAPEPRDAAAPAAESTDAEYTDAQIEMFARAAAKAAGFGPRTWTLKISGGRVQLVVTGQKTTEADGLVVTVEARATVTL